MKVGYPNHPRMDLLKEIDWIAKNGFEFIDLFLEPDLCDVSTIRVDCVKRALEVNRLDAVGHTAWYLPIGSPMPELREASVSAAEKYLKVFAALGVKYVTIHAHWPPSMFTHEEGIAWQTESLQKLAGLAKNLGTGIIYEPVGSIHESKANLKKIFQLNPGIGFHLDIGHFNLNHRDPGDYAITFRDRLTHIHLHDNDGQKDLHLPLGTGCVDWDNLIKKLRSVYDGTVTIEVFSKDRDYVLISKQKFLEKWRAAA